MEKFKYELEKKERYYSEIEQENRRLKPYYEKFNQMKEIIEETMEKVFSLFYFLSFLYSKHQELFLMNFYCYDKLFTFILDGEKRKREPKI